jgi:hypothetical protein
MMTGGSRVPAPSQPTADFEARNARQHPVEDDKVGRIFGEAEFGFVAALHALDHIAFRLEIVGEQESQIRFVLDDENAGAEAALEMQKGRPQVRGRDRAPTLQGVRSRQAGLRRFPKCAGQ